MKKILKETIRDVAYTFVFMMDRYEKYSGEVFNVGLSNANLSKQELVEKIQEYIPDFAVTYSDYYQDPDKRDYIVSNEKLESYGWTPYFSIGFGIRELINAYKVIIKHNDRNFTNL